MLAPQLSKGELKRIQIVRISRQKAIMLFVFSTGMVRVMMIDIAEDMDNAYLEMISNLLTDKVSNLRLSEAWRLCSTIRGDIEGHRLFLNSMLDAVRKNIARAGKEVVLGGDQKHFQSSGIPGCEQGSELFAASGNQGSAV